MELKRAIKKLPSEQNLRLLSSLIVSIANKQSSLEDRVIAPWKADVTYQKDISYVSHNGYVYICSVTNQDSVFTESHWVKLSDNITELTKSDIEALINLSPEEISKLSDLISTEIRLDKVFSSSDTYMRIQAAIDTAKTYTNNQLGKAVKPAYKVVASTSEVTETGYFYLISNGTNYDMYVLSSDGSVVSLGTSDVDLSDYAKLTDLDNYYDKSTSDGKFATITTVDNHINDTVAHMTQDEKDKLVTTDDIATTIDSSSTDDTVAGALTTYNAIKRLMPYIASSVSSEDPDITTKALIRIRHDNAPTSDSEYFILTFFTDDTLEIVEKSQMAFNIGTNAIYTRTKKYNSTWSGWTKILTNDNITTTIDSSSTDTQVPSAKAVEARVNKVNKCTVHSNEDLNLITEPGLYACVGGDTYGATHNFPVPDNGYLQHIAYPADGYSMQTFVPNGVWGGELNMYVRRLRSGVWSSWQRLCGTTVADVPDTVIDISTLNIPQIPSGKIEFSVKNGNCYVTMYEINVASTFDTNIKIYHQSIPKPLHFINWSVIADNTSGNITFVNPNNGCMEIDKTLTKVGMYYGSFSYTVAE